MFWKFSTGIIRKQWHFRSAICILHLWSRISISWFSSKANLEVEELPSTFHQRWIVKLTNPPSPTPSTESAQLARIIYRSTPERYAFFRLDTIFGFFIRYNTISIRYCGLRKDLLFEEFSANFQKGAGSFHIHRKTMKELCILAVLGIREQPNLAQNLVTHRHW